MSEQLTRDRLASGFGPDVKIAAKSGGLFGVIRNEAGVIELADGRRYAAAVFTRAQEPGAREHEINAVIGVSASRAIDSLTAG